MGLRPDFIIEQHRFRKKILLLLLPLLDRTPAHKIIFKYLVMPDDLLFKSVVISVEFESN